MDISEALASGFAAGLLAAGTAVGVLWRRLADKDAALAKLHKDQETALAEVHRAHDERVAELQNARLAELRSVLDAIAASAELIELVRYSRPKSVQELPPPPPRKGKSQP